jgi:hypothetical protein
MPNTTLKPYAWLLALHSNLVMMLIPLETLWDAELTTLELLPLQLPMLLFTAHTLDHLETTSAELDVKDTALSLTLLALEATFSTLAMLPVLPPVLLLPLTEVPLTLPELLYNAELTTPLLPQLVQLTLTLTANTHLLSELILVEVCARTIAKLSPLPALEPTCNSLTLQLA